MNAEQISMCEGPRTMDLGLQENPVAGDSKFAALKPEAHFNPLRTVHYPLLYFTPAAFLTSESNFCEGAWNGPGMATPRVSASIASLWLGGY
jgi:hypothetical protein